MELSPLFLSLKVAFLATVITFLTGLPTAWGILRLRRFKKFLDGLFTLPLVLPPTVVGFGLLVLFGKNRFLGGLLAQADIQLVFTPTAAVIASAAAAFPLMYRTARGAFEQIDENILYAARTLGLPEWRIFLRLAIPVSRPGILAGVVLAFARAMGEFGATIMVAGNIPGRTQTVPTKIYSAMQSGDPSAALVWAAAVSVLSFICLVALNLLTPSPAK
jgi:molybdate transport system permease protein